MNIQFLEKAIKIVGSQARLAEHCGPRVKQQHISNWLHRDKKVPAEYVLSIEQATGGQVSRYELRPDIYPLSDYKPAAYQKKYAHINNHKMAKRPSNGKQNKMKRFKRD